MEQSNIVLKQLFLYGYHHRFYLLQNKSLRMKMDETPTDGILAFQSLRNNLRWPCYLTKWRWFNCFSLLYFRNTENYIYMNLLKTYIEIIRCTLDTEFVNAFRNFFHNEYIVDCIWYFMLHFVHVPIMWKKLYMIRNPLYDN